MLRLFSTSIKKLLRLSIVVSDIRANPINDVNESERVALKKRYAFIKIRSNHADIEQTIKILKYTFHAYDLDIIDIKKLLINNPHIIIVNIFHVISIYGIKTIFGSKSDIYNRFFGTPYIYRNIKRLLHTKASHDYLFTIQDCSLFNGKLDGVPHFVYTDHTVLANKHYPEYAERGYLLSESWMRQERNIYHDADIVFTRSQIIRDSVIEDYFCDPDKVQCIYYAPFTERREQSIEIGKYASKTILFVGMVWGMKGGPLLVSAFARVLKKIPDAHLIIVGCQPVINLPNVDVVGVVENKDIHSYYEKSAIFCLPTRREAFGTVFVEAMTYYLPVIGTKIGAQPEFIFDGDNGYLINVDDVDMLTELLIYLLGNPKICEQMGRRGHDIYREKFTLEVVSSSLKEYITPYIQRSDGIQSI